MFGFLYKQCFNVFIIEATISWHEVCVHLLHKSHREGQFLVVLTMEVKEESDAIPAFQSTAKMEGLGHARALLWVLSVPWFVTEWGAF